MANRNQVPLAVLPLPPAEFDVQYLNNLIKLLNFNFNTLQNPGSVQASEITLTNLPTSPGAPGTVWVDTAAGNVLKISP
jgi:hypothetical protein